MKFFAHSAVIVMLWKTHNWKAYS